MYFVVYKSLEGDICMTNHLLKTCKIFVIYEISWMIDGVRMEIIDESQYTSRLYCWRTVTWTGPHWTSCPAAVMTRRTMMMMMMMMMTETRLWDAKTPPRRCCCHSRSRGFGAAAATGSSN